MNINHTQQTNLELLQKIEEIIEIHLVELDADLKEKIGSEFSEKAEKNSKKINVYRMVYTSQGHKVIGYIVEPKEGSDLPCVVHNRGGSRDFGSIKIGQLFLGLSMFAQSGYITIFSQYSGNAGGEGEDQMGGSDIEDVLVLYEILKKYPRADVSRIGMYGASRGGMMTYLALARTNWIKAAVIVAGTADYVNKKEFRDMEEHYVKMFGGSIEEKKKRSALYWVDKLPKNTPLLIMHGSADWRVNPTDSIHMAEALYKNKVPYKFIMFDGADHGLTEHKAESNKLMLEWFERFVKNNGQLPDLTPHGK